MVAPLDANSSGTTMGFSLLPPHLRELWKEWELRLLILLSLFLQMILATQGSQRKSIFKKWIQFVVWTTYLLADTIAILTLGVLSNRLANIKQTEGRFDLKSQITAFWAPFLLLHLGGPDSISAYALADNELWLRQLARLCIQVGLTCYIYFMALSGSTLSILASGTILVGFIKYAERTLCMYLASKGQLRDSMLLLPNLDPTIYTRKMEQYALKKEEGYRVMTEEVIEASAWKDLSVSVSGDQASNGEKATALVKAYKLFQIFKLLFVGLILDSGDLKASKCMFMDQNMKSEEAFRIMEIELGFMYDLLYTKSPLLSCAWGIIRWVINLLVPCAVLVLFSLQDKKDYPKVDICITFLLVSVTILLEIYSLLQVILSDWVAQWWLQKPGRFKILPVNDLLRFYPDQRWGNVMAQFSLLRLTIRRRNRVFGKYLRLAKLDEMVEKNFYIGYKKFNSGIKEWIFKHMTNSVQPTTQTIERKRELASFNLDASDILTKSNCPNLIWSVKEDFDQSILIWHIATELCYHKDRDNMQDKDLEDHKSYKMSKLVSRYMLYLLVVHPSMLPTGIGVLQYIDTSIDAQLLFEDKLVWSKSEDISSDINNVLGCKKVHKSRESQDLCKICHLLVQVTTDLPVWKLRGDKSTSVLFDACHLASQLNEVSRKWDLIGKVWAKMLIYAACQIKGYEHSESLSRGGELLSHVWLLMAHLGVVQIEQPSRTERITKLIVN